MDEKDKTKEQLLDEVAKLSQRIAESGKKKDQLDGIRMSGSIPVLTYE